MPRLLDKHRPRSDEEDRRILYYLRHSDELTVSEIANHFRRNENYVIKLAKVHGIKRRKRGNADD